MSYKPPAEVKLRRLLYLSTEDSVFVSGDPEVHNYFTADKLTCASELLKEDLNNPGLLSNLFTSIDNNPILARREALFFAAAHFATHEAANDQQRHAFYSLVLNMCRNYKDLFNFIKFLSKIKKPGCSGVQKIICAFYLRQEPLELIKCICESKSYHGWTHKDIIKLIHCKTDNPVIEVILKYILYGEKRAAEAAGENPESLKVVEYAQKIKEFRTCKDENRIAQLIPELDVKTVKQIPPEVIKSQVVWAALIPQLTLNDLISCLPRLYKMGFLKPGVIHTKVIDLLSNQEAIEESQIHPIEVYIGLKNLEKGGKPKDPHLIKYLETKEDVEAKLRADPDYKKPNFGHQEPAKCTAVITALQKTLTASYANLQPSYSKIMITIDANDRMNDHCLTTKNVSCMEAAAIIALTFFKANKAVTIAVFNGNTVTPVTIDKNATLGHVIKKLRDAKHGTVMWSAPFDWAANGGKVFDIFIHIGIRPNILDLTSEDREKDKPREAFERYQNKLNIVCRLITYSLGVHNACFSDNDLNILDMCGFDKNVPKIIDGFCKAYF